MTEWMLPLLQILIPSAVALYAAIKAKGADDKVQNLHIQQQEQSQKIEQRIKADTVESVSFAEIHARQLGPDELSPSLPMVAGPDGVPDRFYGIIVALGRKDDKSLKLVCIPLYTTVSGARRLVKAMNEECFRGIGLWKKETETEHPVLTDTLVPRPTHFEPEPKKKPWGGVE